MNHLKIYNHRDLRKIKIINTLKNKQQIIIQLTTNFQELFIVITLQHHYNIKIYFKQKNLIFDYMKISAVQMFQF